MQVSDLTSSAYCPSHSLSRVSICSLKKYLNFNDKQIKRFLRFLWFLAPKTQSVILTGASSHALTEEFCSSSLDLGHIFCRLFLSFCRNTWNTWMGSHCTGFRYFEILLKKYLDIPLLFYALSATINTWSFLCFLALPIVILLFPELPLWF